MVTGGRGADPVGPATSVDEVITRMREIDAELPVDDGVAVFNRMYLTVTERIAALIAAPGAPGAPGATSPFFADAAAMTALDVRFANLWLAAYDAAPGPGTGVGPVPPAWRPLFEARHAGLVPVQYALAGMNSHIEHDLPVAVLDTCRALGREPESLHDDYQEVNRVLAQVEASIRRSFLDERGRALDDRLGPVVHLISTWNIDKARDLSWVTVEMLWALRRTDALRERYLEGLAHTVGMTTRTLLLPVCGSAGDAGRTRQQPPPGGAGAAGRVPWWRWAVRPRLPPA